MKKKMKISDLITWVGVENSGVSETVFFFGVLEDGEIRALLPCVDLSFEDVWSDNYGGLRLDS